MAIAAALKKEMEKLKENVRSRFEIIREALTVRERLLLRQIEVISTSAKQIMPPSGSDALLDVSFLTPNEEELLCAIRSYGMLDSRNLVLQDVYMLRNEDYIAPSDDHETMYKCLQNEQTLSANAKNAACDTALASNAINEEAIIVDFSKNKSLLEHNALHMNESIVNLTATEAKELIRKANAKRLSKTLPALNLDAIDDAALQPPLTSQTTSDIEEKQKLFSTKPVMRTTATNDATNTKNTKNQQCHKPNITINSCNGIINISNVENLNINCASEEVATTSPSSSSLSVEEAESCSNKSACSSNLAQSTPQHINTARSSKNYSSMCSSNSNNSSLTHSQKHKNNSNNKKTANKNDRKQTKAISKLTAEKGVGGDGGGSDADDGNKYNNAVQCEFYNRLLNEIKNQLKQKSAQMMGSNSNSNNNSNTVTTCTDPHTQKCTTLPRSNKRLVLTNFENLKIVLESNSNSDAKDGSNNAEESCCHPVQIEQWLAEIMSATDLEPMLNTDILEHSRLKKQESCEETQITKK